MRCPSKSSLARVLMGITVSVATLALSAAGCATRDLEWEIRLDPPALSSTAARIDARILRGACPATDVLWEETVYPDDMTNEMPADLEEGTYCFEAFVGDAACQWVAHGATTVALPTDAPLVVVATEQAPASNCSTTCNAGTCATSSGGGNCLAGGCTFRCDDDCSATCEGGGCTMECAGAATCDFACIGGGCHVLCENASACTASCAVGGCDMACHDVSGCDFSCDAGRCDFSCMTSDTCTTMCPLATCTGG